MLFKGKPVNNSQTIKELVSDFYIKNPYAPSYTYHRAGSVKYGDKKVLVSTTNKGTAIKLEHGDDYFLLDERCHINSFSASKELLRLVIG